MPRKYKRKEGTRARVCSRTSEDLQSAINQTNFFIEKDNDDTINLSNKKCNLFKAIPRPGITKKTKFSQSHQR